MAKKVLTHTLSEPLGGVTTAKVELNMVDGNLTIDGLTGSNQELVSGTIEYLENQGLPTRSVKTINHQASFTLQASGVGQPWFRLPWAACNGASAWQIHLNPTVSFDITAHTGGGNVILNLAGAAITRVTADTGGGNMEIILPDNTADLSVAAKSGAGNVVVRVPGGIAARIQATSGLGKVIMDPRFNKIDGNTYQSSDYDQAAARVEMTLTSGAGNVSVTEKIARDEAVAVQK